MIDKSLWSWLELRDITDPLHLDGAFQDHSLFREAENLLLIHPGQAIRHVLLGVEYNGHFPCDFGAFAVSLVKGVAKWVGAMEPIQDKSALKRSDRSACADRSGAP